MKQNGVKQLTDDNWLMPDETVPTSLSPGLHGPIPDIDGSDLASQFLAVSLSARVPGPVHDLFGQARAMMAYAYFFYPFYAKGMEELYRVMEAAVRHRTQMLLAPPSIKAPYGKLLNRLIGAEVIPKSDRMRWEAARKLRNTFSHPTGRALIMPQEAYRLLQLVQHDIEFLFREIEPHSLDQA